MKIAKQEECRTDVPCDHIWKGSEWRPRYTLCALKLSCPYKDENNKCNRWYK